MAERGIFSLLLALVLFVLYCVIWALCVLGWRTARTRYAGRLMPSRMESLPSSSAPGVTIIRPLCGLDNNLYNALESTMKLDYPKYEVIFALQDEKDEALAVVKMVIEKYPEVSTRIIIDDRKVGVNPKINNLMTPFEQASYDLLWVIDATISVGPGTLGRTVDAFLETSSFSSSFDSDLESTQLMSDDMRKPPVKGDVGLVHHVPYAVVYQRTWGSLIEQAFLNTTHAKMYLAINATAVDSCVMGKSNLYSRANIASLTTPSPTLRSRPNPPSGLAGFSPFLAEDNMIALGLWHELGLKHAMTSDVALDFLGALSVRDYINRRVRWIRVRKKMTPIFAVLIEPFTESILCGIYGAWAIDRIFIANRVAIFFVHMVIWLLLDLSVRRSLGANVKGIGPPSSTPLFVVAWLAREVLTLPIWLYGIISSDVTWRGKRYRILNSGEAVALDE
ncbi:glycosyltransferase like family 2-domain-containing protein [Naematelia encephala]|uniref:Ceramide glucosyltransferase n=1 Tax=Naematelia encephala TaxID=71784 RepID=A0A1Y2ARZ2_9TREE|nr:glycosyltransferase like family 2-domain-containing protein [Naematelia encephala]